MGRITKLQVKNFKSVKELVEIRFPQNAPLVLVGENNSGKSNLVRALELVLGEGWPGTYDPEDHDFHNRDKENLPIEIGVNLEGVSRIDGRGAIHEVQGLVLRYPSDGDRPFRMVEDEGRENPYVGSDVREQCVCIVVGADRRLSYQLSYVSKYTFLSKLMRKFHQALTLDAPRVDHLKAKFVEVRALFQEVAPFAVFADELREQISELTGNLDYRLGVDFSAYDPSNYFHALRVQPLQGDEVRTFEELGTGQEQLLALSFAYAYAKAFHGDDCGLVVVVEEPEAHLHPLAQKWVGQKIRELATEGVQVVVTTHSPAFVNILGLEGIAVLHKEEGATRVLQLARRQLAEHCRKYGATKATEETVVPFYAAAATEELLGGFFARRVVIAEGPTEALALPIYLSRVGFSTAKEGTAILPVHGVGNLAKWWRLFTAYGVPVYVIFDNDAGDDPDAFKRKDILKTLGVPNERFHGLLGGAQWVVEDGFSIFGHNFEETMRSQFGQAYINLETEARDSIGLSAERSKPLVARYVAEHLPQEGEHARSWDILRQLAAKIREA